MMCNLFHTKNKLAASQYECVIVRSMHAYRLCDWADWNDRYDII